MYTQITVENLNQLEQLKGKNGLAFLDCDMHPLELLNAVNEALTHGGILLNGSELEDVFSYQHDGTVDMLLPFNNAQLHSSKIVIWQMMIYKDCRGIFLSDYIRNTLQSLAMENARQTEQPAGSETPNRDLSQKGHSQNGNDLKKILTERLEQSCKAYMEDLQGKTASELIAMAPEITAVQQLQKELLDACDKEDVAFLLQFDDPLKVVLGYWKSEITEYDHGSEMGHMLWRIRDRKLYSNEQLVQPLTTGREAQPSVDKKNKSSKRGRKEHER